MKYVKQTCIITGMTLAGEILGSVLPLPDKTKPASSDGEPPADPGLETVKN